jgi:hypothetical protein
MLSGRAGAAAPRRAALYMAATEPHVLRSRLRVPTSARVPDGPARVVLSLALTVAGGAVALLLLHHVPKLSTNGRELILTVGASIVLPLLFLPWRGLAGGVAALAVAWLIAALLYTWAPDHVYIASPVQDAVGASAYAGTPYLPGQYASVVLQLLVLGAGVIGALLLRRFSPSPVALAEPVAQLPGTDGDGDPPPWYRRTWVGAAAVAVACVLITLTIYPNVYDGALTIAASAPPDGWDTENFITWNWLVNGTHELAMRDFFWPYGYTWVFYEFPAGFVYQWLTELVTVGLCGWALWRLVPSEGRVTRIALCLLALPIMNMWEGHLWRYAVPFAVIIAYAALGPARHRRPTWGHAVVGFGVLFAGMYQLDLIITVIVGAGFVLIADVLAGRAPRSPRELARGVAVDLVALVPLVLVPLSWLVFGGFDGYYRFYTGLRGTSALGASDTSLGALAQYIGARPSAAMLRVTAPALTLVTAFALNAFGGPRAAGAARLLFAGSAVGFLIVIKHLVRNIGDASLEFTILAGLWAAALLWTSRRPVLSLLIGAYVATALFTFDRIGAVDGWWNVYAKDAKRRVTQSFDLIGKDDEVAAQRRLLFERRRFAGWTYAQQQATVLQQAMAGARRRNFFVLGDAPILYVWFKQPPPFQFQLYDTARRADQEVVVDRLKAQDPEFVLWRFDFAQDGVPQYVRDPIIFRYVVDNYVPVTATQYGDVLRKRRGKPVDPDYWVSRLTRTESVGFVPASSTAEDADECSGGTGCNPYVILKGDPKGKRFTSFRISGHGRTFRVTVATRPEAKEYPVRLDRLWFWSVVGPAATVRALRPGWKAERVNLKTGDALW